MDDPGKITSFDKDHYDQLITYLGAVGASINAHPAALGSSADLKLDNTLGSRLHPGSQDWSVAKDFTTQAGAFGSSVHARYTAVESELRAFTKALKGAEDVFDDTNDLTTYDASKFEQDYPDVAGSGSGSGVAGGGGVGTGSGAGSDGSGTGAGSDDSGSGTGSGSGSGSGSDGSGSDGSGSGTTT